MVFPRRRCCSRCSLVSHGAPDLWACLFQSASNRERDCVCYCARECDCTSVLINSPPISHDMFISLLPVCIVNAEPDLEQRQTWWLVRACARVCVSALNKRELPSVVWGRPRPGTQRHEEDEGAQTGAGGEVQHNIRNSDVIRPSHLFGSFIRILFGFFFIS